MALVDSLTTATRAYYQPGLPDNIFIASPFWSQFYPKRKHEVGLTIRAPIKSGKLGGGPYLKNTQLTLTTPEVITYAEYGWKLYYVPIQLYNYDVKINAAAGGEQVVDLLDAYIGAASETMRDSHLGTDIFEYHDHDTYASLDGLKDMCQEADIDVASAGYYAAGYGGILEADMDTWKAHVVRATGEAGAWVPVPCTVEVVRSLIVDIVSGSNGCGKAPSMMVTTATVFQALSRELFNKGIMTVITKRGQDLVQAGFSAIEIDNIPIVADPHCPGVAWSEAADADTYAYNLVTGHHLYAVNFDNCWPNVHPDVDMELHDWMDETDYDRMTSRLTFWGNIICDERRAHGALYNIDPLVLYDSE